ncbi:hypothetical protein BH11PLA1_BH11PLA1_15560 [soil metagenome]
MLLLTVIQGPDKGRTFELPDNEPQLVGRSSEALQLTDTTISRRHSELTPDKGEWYIQDLGSQNGTFVNSVRIHQRTRLNAGDQIRTGATLLIYGKREERLERGAIRFVRQMDSAVQAAMVSSEDSVILEGPAPGHSATDHLRMVYAVTQLTTQLPERGELLEGIMSLIFDEFRPERGVIMLTTTPEQVSGAVPPTPAVVRYANETAAGAPVLPGEIIVSRTILQHVLKKNEGVLSSNAMTDPRFARAGGASPHDSIASLNTRSAICAPIRFRDRTFGVIYIDTSTATYSFTADQLALVNAIGQHTGLALANAELYAQKLRTERLAAMGETVASLSHSIKNILQGLRGGGDVVEMGLRKEDLKIARGGWAILKRNLDRIIGLTMNMLAYSRPRPLEVELTKIGPLLDDCAQLLQDLCAARGVVLLVDADADMPPIPVDQGQLHQALMNLMTNAVEAVDAQSGVVTVKATFKDSQGRSGPSAGLGGAGGAARITVIDNGPGVPPEIRQRIFEPFFTTKGLRGTGLGLAVTRRIIEQHGGRIELVPESAGPGGKGAAFTVILPVLPGQLIDPSQTTAADGNRGRAGSA